ncbi:MAG: ATP-binding cassette domain-containing protein [Bacteroides sp.]
MIQVKEISFAYHRKQRVLDGFSLSLQPGRVYGLLGKNGAGKSTLLYLMSGLLVPACGQVLYRGVDVRRRLPQTLGDLFLVPEEFDLPAISLVSYIELNAPFYPRFSKEDMVTYLHLFDMNIDVHLGALSMGQKKKVFMCFALATHTSLLLMDEPTNGLDIPSKSQFRRFIASGMSDDRTILISTHQVRDIDRILDHVIIMDNRGVLLDASTADICSRFRFVESDDPALAEEAVYTLPSLQGHLMMLPNGSEAESELNLELLFGATLAHPDRMAALFHAKKEEEER